MGTCFTFLAAGPLFRIVLCAGFSVQQRHDRPAKAGALFLSKGTEMNSSRIFTRLLATTVLTAGFAIPAYAQDTTDDPQAQSVGQTPDAAVVDDTSEAVSDDPRTDVITVTGSRIARPEIESSSPLVMTSDEEIRLSGNTRIEDTLNNLPQVEAAQTAFISNGATGTATLDLRGLGSIRTLVLVNGRRLQPGSTFATAADVNQIPGAIVERIDVVTGGASSVYGADAVAGVVNFIMDTDFEGIQLDVSGSGYLHDNRNEYISPLLAARGFGDPKDMQLDGTQWSVDLTMGSSFDGGRGHAVVYATYRKVNELLQGSRDYSFCALNAGGTACGGSGSAALPTLYFFSQEDFSDFTGPFGLQPDTTITPGSNLYNFAPINHFQRPDERYTLGAFANYEINSSFNPYLEVMYMNDRTVAQIAASGTFFAEVYEIECNSPLLTAAQQQTICGDILGIDPATGSFFTYIGKRNVEGGPRQSRIQHDAFRVVAGMRGDITDRWRYDVYGQYGTSHLSNAYLNDFFAPKVRDAIEGVTRNADGELVCAPGSFAGCIPYQVFGPPGSITPEAARALGSVGILEGITKEYIASGFVAGDLGTLSPWAVTPVQVVLGAEYRKEVYDQLSDEVFEAGALLGQGGPTPSVNGSFDLWEVFGELGLTIAEDQSWAQELSIDLGYRYSHYSTAGGTHTYKVAGNWRVIPQVGLRGAYNRAVRAPNAPELFTPQSIGLWTGTDPCAGTTPEYTEAQCANTGVLPGQYGNIGPNNAGQYNSLFGGNPDLAPEKADTITAGVILQPLRRLVFTADYWDIKINEVVGVVPQEVALGQCAETGNAQFCDLINRGPGGTLWLGQAGYVITTNQNLGSLHYRGLDFGLDYSMDVGPGRLSVDGSGTYLLQKETVPIPGDLAAETMYDCQGLFGANCFPSPKWRHNLRLTYEFPETWLISTRWRHVGSVKNEITAGEPGLPSGTPAALNAEVNGQNYFDLTLQAEINEHFTWTIGANNIFDKEPPLLGSQPGPTNANTFAGFWDTLGRYVFTSASIRF